MGRFGKVLLGWGPTLVANVVLPLLTYSWLTDRGLTEASALALSGVWPAVEVAVMFAVRRRVDEFGVLTLIIIALGVGSSLALRDGRLVLFKESAVTGLFGLLLLASLLARRPLMFYFGRRFATDGSPERVAWWDGLWQYAGFRRTQRILTVVWGVTFLAEAALRIELTEVLSIDTMVVINAVLPYAVTAALVTWTILYSRQARRRAPAAAVAPA
ncbi:VC0807 family protein [Dactylosporangium sp. AC04546]|uniref:VC0807 family protein n=1 Tax=Dactylosporangium sp. AC04546 TaxID=2862460 RepID=UPI001EE0F593|nr:VC0807 family protein [Dactylosporangium sp. AC04546]WVK79707.1 VC0807 family protein [Dactylosporangium sp. AC04546]